MSQVPDDLAKGCRQAQMIGAMLILSLASYAYIVETVRARQTPFIGYVPTAPVGVLRLVLAGMALVSLLAATIVLFLLAGQRTDFYGFAALALLAFAWHFPRRSQWEEWA